MEETEQLSNLIANIYDAVLEPALWTGVVEKAGCFVGGSGASLFWQDAVRRVGNSYYHFGVDARYEQLYFNKYVRFDPLSAAYFPAGFFFRSASIAACGSAMTNRSSFGPRLPLGDLLVLAIGYYHLVSCLGRN